MFSSNLAVFLARAYDVLVDDLPIMIDLNHVETEDMIHKLFESKLIANISTKTEWMGVTNHCVYDLDIVIAKTTPYPYLQMVIYWLHDQYVFTTLDSVRLKKLVFVNSTS